MEFPEGNRAVRYSGENPLPKDKHQFRSDEIYQFTQVKPFVLKFWESEFPVIKPRRNSEGHVVYTREKVETIRQIKHMLHEEGCTLAAARARLAGKTETADPSKSRGGKTPPRTAGQSEEKKPLLPTGSGSATNQKVRSAPAGEESRPENVQAEKGSQKGITFEDLLPTSLKKKKQDSVNFFASKEEIQLALSGPRKRERKKAALGVANVENPGKTDSKVKKTAKPAGKKSPIRKGSTGKQGAKGKKISSSGGSGTPVRAPSAVAKNEPPLKERMLTIQRGLEQILTLLNKGGK